MTPSQHFLPIKDIRDNLVFLKDRSVSLVLTTSAVNFSLLFETEQVSIIEDFAGLLNSLSFPIQINILSKRLDVSSYLLALDRAQAQQTNPLLQAITVRFRHFVESIIKENNVLDKEFYICLSATPFELGLLPKSISDESRAATTILNPRKDHLIRQVSQLGLKARQLTSEELIKLFYGIYNLPDLGKPELPKTITSPSQSQPIPPPAPPPPLTQTNLPQRAMGNEQPASPTDGRVTSYPLTPPFTVEELIDDV